MLFLDSYIKQTVSSAEWSKIFVAESVVVGAQQVINQTFSNQSVAVIFISNLLIVPQVAPIPAFSIIDNFGIRIAETAGAGGGNLSSNFFYFVDGDTLNFTSNSNQVKFYLYYQLVYDRKEKVAKSND